MSDNNKIAVAGTGFGEAMTAFTEVPLIITERDGTQRNVRLIDSDGGQEFWDWFDLLQAEVEKAEKADVKLIQKFQVELIHQCMIDAALGRTEQARRLLTAALERNPGFDPLQAARAKSTLNALDDGMSR